MSLADKIRARVDSMEVNSKECLIEMSDIFATELRVVLGKAGIPDNPSKPGEAPHKVTGELVGSIVTEVYTQSGVAYVGPTAAHGKYLEPLRPFYEITAESIRQRMRDLLDDI